MKAINQLSMDELESLIEKKILEILGDPDAGLELREDFKEKIKARMSKKSKRISHKEIVEKGS